ncbi:MAG: histidine--tRNA ligase [Pseudomonadota bacterium]|nr:histidine--tRNA ligase [Pseudomonadota bacterium]
MQSVRGFNDLYNPSDIAKWSYLESVFRSVVKQYAYDEVRLPIMEHTELFTRAIGTTTDIVHKEMYTFDDKNNKSVSLRPEGTASCVRLCLQHQLLYNQSQRFFYIAPMFRRERPQKGRLRQFHQFGVECIGEPQPNPDIEHLIMLSDIWKSLSVSLRLKINYIGGESTRANYIHALKAFYKPVKHKLDELETRRYEQNTLRLLDSKKSWIVEYNKQAPRLIEYLNSDECSAFDAIKSALESESIAFELDDSLVRGIDYYTGLIYEWQTDQLGAQSAVCGGGRYDSLCSQLGKQDYPATGFSVGIERLIELIADVTKPHVSTKAVWIDTVDVPYHKAIHMCRKIREQCDIELLTFHQEKTLKSKLKRANHINASYAIILGKHEHHHDTLLLKHLGTGNQQSLGLDELIQSFKTKE